MRDLELDHFSEELDRRTERDHGEEAEGRSEGEQRREIEEQLVRDRTLGKEVFLEEHLQDVGGDVREALERHVAEPGDRQPGAIRPHPILHERAPLPLRHGEQRRGDHHEDEVERDDVADALEGPERTAVQLREGAHQGE